MSFIILHFIKSSFINKLSIFFFNYVYFLRLVFTFSLECHRNLFVQMDCNKHLTSLCIFYANLHSNN